MGLKWFFINLQKLRYFNSEYLTFYRIIPYLYYSAIKLLPKTQNPTILSIFDPQYRYQLHQNGHTSYHNGLRTTNGVSYMVTFNLRYINKEAPGDGVSPQKSSIYSPFVTLGICSVPRGLPTNKWLHSQNQT